ncbi:MAG TPA: HAD hydrolase-like protein [Bryobacteraceae bacterium]|nr:HAD hydrolase-like protein [Bryobacteraceae bacterium]
MAADRLRQYLIIDADDTLWENNIYFERAFDDFCEFLDHSRLSALEIRAVLDEIEIVNARVHGYGSKSFGRNLTECYQHLVEREIWSDDIATVMRFAERILEQPIEPIDGVQETLEYLSARHDLTLFTKGDPEEQKLKVDRSGLGVYFGHTAIVKEKNIAAYHALVSERGLAEGETWMVGNSPKSDINPALAAGLNAVFIPHAHTWRLEHEEVQTGPGKFLQLESFADLRRHF